MEYLTAQDAHNLLMMRRPLSTKEYIMAQIKNSATVGNGYNVSINLNPQEMNDLNNISCWLKSPGYIIYINNNILEVYW